MHFKGVDGARVQRSETGCGIRCNGGMRCSRCFYRAERGADGMEAITDVVEIN
jgi:hypothetical protein